MQSQSILNLKLKNAVENDHPELIKNLVELKADPNLAYDNGKSYYFPIKTALIHAIDHNHSGVLTALLEAKANPDICIPPHVRDGIYNYLPHFYLIPLNRAVNNYVCETKTSEEKNSTSSILEIMLQHGVDVAEEDIEHAKHEYGNFSRGPTAIELLRKAKDEREFPPIKKEIENTFQFFAMKRAPDEKERPEFSMPTVLVDMITDQLKP